MTSQSEPAPHALVDGQGVGQQGIDVWLANRLSYRNPSL